MTRTCVGKARAAFHEFSRRAFPRDGGSFRVRVALADYQLFPLACGLFGMSLSTGYRSRRHGEVLHGVVWGRRWRKSQWSYGDGRGNRRMCVLGFSLFVGRMKGLVMKCVVYYFLDGRKLLFASNGSLIYFFFILNLFEKSESFQL